MKCTRCGTNVDREATDRGICFDCYCQLDLQDYEAHLQLRDKELRKVIDKSYSMDDSGAELVGDDAIVPLLEEE